MAWSSLRVMVVKISSRWFKIGILNQILFSSQTSVKTVEDVNYWTLMQGFNERRVVAGIQTFTPLSSV